jgi:serine/threonine protein kinase/Tol biopolymer transport system component
MIGTQLGRNRIIEKLGEGGMGAVYRGEDEHLGRNVAIKVLPAGALSNEAARRQFLREAKTLSRLSHPNIELVYDFDTQDGVDFLVLEYIPGKTLKDVLAMGPLTEKEIARFASQIAEGLAAAHEQGIVHCDLKPANLMVAPDGRLKILDFGLARFVKLTNQEVSTDSMPLRRAHGGTLPYMSPEQLAGEAVDARSDIYAMGNVLYEMATGRVPFQESSPTALVNEILHKQPPMPGRLRPDLSPRLEETILKCLEKDPENRYQSAKELLVDLRRSSPSESGPVIASTYRRRMRPIWRRATITGAAALTVLLTWLVWSVRRPTEWGPPLQLTSDSGWGGEPALSPPDGKWIAYVSLRAGSQDIYVIDSRGEHAPQPLTKGPAEHSDPAWLANGQEIAFTSELDGKISIRKVPLLGGEESLLIGDACHPAISSDGTKITFCKLLPGNRCRLAMAPLADLAAVKYLSDEQEWSLHDYDAAWNPDGSTVCFAGIRNLYLRSVVDGRTRELTSDGAGDFDPCWSADGDYVYFASYRNNIISLWRVRASGGTPEPVTDGTSREKHPDISRDGKVLAYGTEETQRQLRLLDRDSGHVTVLPGSDWYPVSIAPDKSKIVFAMGRSGLESSLWMQQLEKGRPTGSANPVPSGSGTAMNPAFSPDGRWIAYSLRAGGQSDIFILPVAGGPPSQFTKDPSRDELPAWSPRSDKIAFCSERSGSPQIWIQPVKEGKPAGPAENVTGSEIPAYSPAWSPDGRRIAFLGLKDNQFDLWWINLEGKREAHQVTHGQHIKKIQWAREMNELVASGLWGGNKLSLQIVDPESGRSRSFRPEIDLGFGDAIGVFDISSDGKLLAYSYEEQKQGDIFVRRAK